MMQQVSTLPWLSNPTSSPIVYVGNFGHENKVWVKDFNYVT